MVNIARFFNPCSCGCNLSKGQCASHRSWIEWKTKWDAEKAAQEAKRKTMADEERALYAQLSPAEKLDYRHKKRMEEIALTHASAHAELARNAYRSDSIDGSGL